MVRRGILAIAMLFMAVFGVTATVGAAPGNQGPGCVEGGRGYVGNAASVPSADPVMVTLHASFVISLCGGGHPQSGDTYVQHIRYADGTTENYKLVYSTNDYHGAGAPFCYWDLTLDPGFSGTGYHCPAGTANTDLKEYIVSSSGDSPYLEPQSGGYQSRPNGIGVYR